MTTDNCGVSVTRVRINILKYYIGIASIGIYYVYIETISGEKISR